MTVKKVKENGKDRKMETSTRVFCLEEAEWKRLKAVRTRLYSERKLDGDSMRDLAQEIQWIMDQVIVFNESDIGNIPSVN